MGMVKNRKKMPKLRAGAAQCRALVPCALHLAETMLAPCDDPTHATLQQAARELHTCYQCLSRAEANFKEEMAAAARRFALLYVELQASEPAYFNVTPKLHMWLHACEEGTRPASTWTYRDEEWGGTCATLAKRRGGVCTPTSLSRQLLWRFAAKTPMVRLG